jgi:hypothetical protein
MTTIREELYKFIEDKDFALVNMRSLINFLEEGIEEIEDKEIQLKYDELQDLLDKKIMDLMSKEIKND